MLAIARKLDLLSSDIALTTGDSHDEQMDRYEEGPHDPGGSGQELPQGGPDAGSVQGDLESRRLR